jgi:hypothetical protein
LQVVVLPLPNDAADSLVEAVSHEERETKPSRRRTGRAEDDMNGTVKHVAGFAVLSAALVSGGAFGWRAASEHGSRLPAGLRSHALVASGRAAAVALGSHVASAAVDAGVGALLAGVRGTARVYDAFLAVTPAPPPSTAAAPAQAAKPAPKPAGGCCTAAGEAETL